MKYNCKKSHRFHDVQKLQMRIKEQKPSSGEYFYNYKLQEAKKQCNILEENDFHKKYKINFKDLPISQIIQNGLQTRNFNKMTEVQRCLIPHALADCDAMVASRTGSGKTLAYLIPLVQKLYRQKFIPLDGLGAMVIVPVRQLAIQVFEVLNSFTNQMQLNVGLIIGGKNVEFQQQKISNMNILICTPGRLLQHLEQTYGFQSNNLKMLILDQADIMLEMGFRQTLKSIMNYLPKCQTMLFSATLSQQIHNFASISLQDPERIFLHNIQTNQKIAKSNIYETPSSLQQYYMIVKYEDKISILYSFLKTHPRQKILIFASTCKQVRFIYEAFKKFKFGTPIYELQGHQKQKKRMAIYFTFCQKKYGILICTNIASRGLDFPLINWVIQIDIPEDIQTYIHRVGRTARYNHQGKSLVFVSENQKKFVQELKNKNVGVQKIQQNPQQLFRIQSSLQSICSQYQQIKYLAQRAIISYLKFIHKAANKQIFKISFIDNSKLAQSYGLLNAPIIKQLKNDSEEKVNKIQKMREKNKKSKAEQKMKKMIQKRINIESNYNEEKQLFTVKSIEKKIINKQPLLQVSRHKLKKIHSQGLFEGRNKVYFDENLRQISVDQYNKTQLQQANKNEPKSDRITSMRNRISIHKNKDQQIEKQRRKIRRKKIFQSKQSQNQKHDKRNTVIEDYQEEEQ